MLSRRTLQAWRRARISPVSGSGSLLFTKRCAKKHLLLETVLENSAANIYAKRKDGRYIYINREMEITCNVTREQGLGKTDFDLFPMEIAEPVPLQRSQRHDDGKLVESEEKVRAPWGEQLVLSKKVR